MEALLKQEDTDRDLKITIEDDGPKVIGETIVLRRIPANN